MEVNAFLIAVTPEPKRALTTHLRQLLAMLKAPKSAAAASRAESAQPDDVAALSGAARRGYCCRNGDDSAYLDVKALARVWNDLAHLSREALASRYVSVVLDQSFEGSCIFHSKHGCSLPRAMRSHTCLDYYWPVQAALSASDQLGT
jgi:hypothetical protein